MGKLLKIVHEQKRRKNTGRLIPGTLKIVNYRLKLGEL